jgi:hypothetical protein
MEVVSFTPPPLCPEETAPGIHIQGGWMDSRAGLDVIGKNKFLAPAENRTLTPCEFNL